MPNPTEKIQLVVKLLETAKEEGERCKDCESCRLIKAMHERIILLSSQIIYEQSVEINNQPAKSLDELYAEDIKDPNKLN